MACINPDGSITASAKALLAAAASPSTPEELAGALGQSLFKVRSSLREMAGAGLVEESGGRYATTVKGAVKAELAA